MAISIAEYLGQDTSSKDLILPVPEGDNPKCPFMNQPCTKIKQRNKPVCAVRKTNGQPWIVCSHRLCSTSKNIPLTSYQEDILLEIAKAIFYPQITKDKILIKREVRIHVVDNSSYKADYVMVSTDLGNSAGPKRVILEMQGGGETSNTGHITKHIKMWEKTPSNELLAQMIRQANTIETNAWRRQQEQFLVKGNIAMQTGGGIVFCVGAPLYDYLWSRIKNANLNNLRDHNWTLALIGFSENRSSASKKSLQFNVDPERLLFTSYINFVQALISQGYPQPEIFQGEFVTLEGKDITLG